MRAARQFDTNEHMAMNSTRARPNTVTEYLHAAPEQVRAKLRQMRACVRQAAPGAKEGLKWGMPAYSYHRILVTFAAFKHHIGFSPTPSAMSAFKGELAGFITAAASVRFPIDRPLPLALIRAMTEFRVRESLEEDKKWRV